MLKTVALAPIPSPAIAMLNTVALSVEAQGSKRVTDIADDIQHMTLVAMSRDLTGRHP